MGDGSYGDTPRVDEQESSDGIRTKANIFLSPLFDVGVSGGVVEPLIEESVDFGSGVSGKE